MKITYTGENKKEILDYIKQNSFKVIHDFQLGVIYAIDTLNPEGNRKCINLIENSTIEIIKGNVDVSFRSVRNIIEDFKESFKVIDHNINLLSDKETAENVVLVHVRKSSHPELLSSYLTVEDVRKIMDYTKNILVIRKAKRLEELESMKKQLADTGSVFKALHIRQEYEK